MVVEINGVKLDVDMESAKVVNEYKVGMNVKVLVKEYSGYVAYPGVITEFVNFKELPTIVIAIFKESYLGVDIEFVYYNTANADKYEIAPSCEHELKINKGRAVDKFNNFIEKKKAEMDEAIAKRDYFIKYFDKHFSE